LRNEFKQFLEKPITETSGTQEIEMLPIKHTTRKPIVEEAVTLDEI
jgi:hypothetical protein